MLAIISACSDGSKDENTKKFEVWTKESVGVILRAYEPSSPYLRGSLENTNAYPVRIRKVWQFQGETTKSVDLLEPGEKLSINKLSHQHGFYIYTKDGVMIGWISGDDPEDDEE